MLQSPNQLLEPDVLSLKTFDQLDCTKILQTALSITHGVIETRIKLADAQHKGTRRAKEAGAEITSMKAELKLPDNIATFEVRAYVVDGDGAILYHIIVYYIIVIL